ncbi:MAG TPA: KTSC domain-containing protein [Chthoniobacterales bacterium]|nr:KTSC domain-containing protein [Chthoniobacterales bacterium]
MAVLLLAAVTLQAEPAGIVSRIKRIPVESSALAAVGYSKKLRALEIEFRNGAIYRYFEVPPDVYDGFVNARSKARFYDDNIRHKYRSLHVRPRAP